MSNAAGPAQPKMFLDVDLLIKEIRETLPNAEEWLKTPHPLLGGATPLERLAAGQVEAVRNLFESILFIGIS